MGSCVHFSCKNNDDCLKVVVEEWESGRPLSGLSRHRVSGGSVLRESGHPSLQICWRNLRRIESVSAICFLTVFSDVMFME